MLDWHCPAVPPMDSSVEAAACFAGAPCAAARIFLLRFDGMTSRSAQQLERRSLKLEKFMFCNR